MAGPAGLLLGVGSGLLLTIVVSCGEGTNSTKCSGVDGTRYETLVNALADVSLPLQAEPRISCSPYGEQFVTAMFRVNSPNIDDDLEFDGTQIARVARGELSCLVTLSGWEVKHISATDESTLFEISGQDTPIVSCT